MNPPEFSSILLQSLESAETAFTATVEAIHAEPYKLRRSIAAWPYYTELQQIVQQYQKPGNVAMHRAYNTLLYERLRAIPIFLHSDAWK